MCMKVDIFFRVTRVHHLPTLVEWIRPTSPRRTKWKSSMRIDESVRRIPTSSRTPFGTNFSEHCMLESRERVREGCLSISIKITLSFKEQTDGQMYKQTTFHFFVSHLSLSLSPFFSRFSGPWLFPSLFYTFLMPRRHLYSCSLNL